MTKYPDFKAIKAAVSIEDAAKLLNLTLKQHGSQLRGGCPACSNEDPRILALTPSRNIFFCWDAKVGGSCLDLVQHITGLELIEAAQFLDPHSREEPHRSPSPPAGKEAKKAEVTFDPAAFASKLTYSPEVEALGISEADATRLGIGWHPNRKAVYFPVSNPDGTPSGFIAWKDGKLVLPPKWLATNVVKLKRA